jgi:hypothetical protein
MKPEYQEHEGHRIEIRRHGEQTELLVDNVPVKFGQLPNGKYFLDDYAFDWTDDLMELARRYISYQARVTQVKARQAGRKGK